MEDSRDRKVEKDIGVIFMWALWLAICLSSTGEGMACSSSFCDFAMDSSGHMNYLCAGVQAGIRKHTAQNLLL
jgi:hypothetical protein